MATLYISSGSIANDFNDSDTYYSSWTDVYSSTKIKLQARSWATMGYTSGSGYWIGNIGIQLMISGLRTVSGNFYTRNTTLGHQDSSWTTKRSKSISYNHGSPFAILTVFDNNMTTFLNYTGTSYINPASYYTDQSLRGTITTTWEVNLQFTNPASSTTFYINTSTTISGKGTKKYTRTMTFSGNGGNVSRPTITGTAGTTVNLSSVSASGKPSEKLDDIYYTISFNSQGGTAVGSIETTKRTGNRTFSHSGWYWSYNGNSYGTSASVRMPDANSTMTATWSSTDNYTGDTTIQYLPSTKPIKKGYIFSNWSYSATSNSQVSVGDRITKNTTVYAMYNPKTYKVNYNTTGLKFEEPNHRPLNFDKTYNANAILETNTAPSKIGYKFDGWVDNKGRVYKPGATFNDATYNEIADASTNPTITLSPKWSLINNTIKFHYYNSQTGASEVVDTENYNIETESFSKGAPKNPMGGDYVFLGWTKTKPSNWTTQRGIYPIADQAPKHEMPVVVKNIQNIVDWGTTENYYGFWTISGKYIKIDGKWRKSNMTYVKIEDKWRPVVNIYNKINGHWRPEVGRN